MARILLIEDNDSTRDLVCRYLELFNHEVATACDGESGLKKAQDHRASLDVVLMDMNLPDIDGWEIARRLKADGATRDLPVIALTAHAMVGDREKALAAGCDEYATKPVEFDELFRKIDTLTRPTAAP